MKNLTIFFVTNNYKPYSGGVVSSIDATAGQLRSLGHTVYIVTLDFDGNKGNEPFLIRLTCPIRFKYKLNCMALPLFPTIQVTQLIKKLKPDLMHVHHPFLLGAAARDAARKQNVPVFFTYHTMYEQYSHYVPLPQQVVKYYARSLSITFCNTVDGVIAPSNTVRNYLLEQGVQQPIAVIPSGILPIFFSTNFENLSDNSVFTLLTVSRFTPEKNIPFLLEMFALLPQKRFRLKLIGYGAQLAALKTYAYENLQLSPERVQFVEKPDKAHIAHQYRSADLFVFASQTETQGLVLYEAMAGGLPVIALTGPGQQDLVENGKNGYLVPDRDAMAITIIKIAQDASLLAQLRQGAGETARVFTPEKMGERLLRFYRGVVG